MDRMEGKREAQRKQMKINMYIIEGSKTGDVKHYEARTRNRIEGKERERGRTWWRGN